MKYLKFFLISSFLILFLGVCNVVSALEMNEWTFTMQNTTGADAVGFGNLLFTNVNFKNSWDKILITNFNVDGYDYLSFGLQMTYSWNGGFYGTYSDLYSSNTQTETTNNYYICNEWITKQQTYADGTKSSYQVCNNWQLNNNFELTNGATNGTINSSITNVPEIGVLITVLFDDNSTIYCDLTTSKQYGNSIVNCKIPNTAKRLRRIRFRNTGTNFVDDIYGDIGIQQVGMVWKDPINSVFTEQKETNSQLQDMNDNITSTDISGASQDQSNIVNNPAFQDNTGLSGIITAPLSMISSLTNTCQPIQLTLPYLKDTNVSIPCMGNFLQSKVPALVTLIKVFVNGFICYLIGLDLFKIVKNARDPDNDRIEVLDL